MMFAALFIAVVMTPLLKAPVGIVQKTSGWCSPAIANVVGSVTVNCIGADPRALSRLNAELSRKNLAVADKIREADEWTSRYQEVEIRLREAGDDTALSRQAEEYLHEGELEKLAGFSTRSWGMKRNRPIERLLTTTTVRWCSNCSFSPWMLCLTWKGPTSTVRKM
jgi:hypothetical protein